MLTNKNEITHEDITKAVQAFENYKAIQQKQKMRGNNDFNPLTIVLDPSDEVRLHTRFLHNLLSPAGTHCQGSLFLEIFLKVCGLNNFDININECFVYKEYDFIDLYITDGVKHIIIENKVYAADQNAQIERYIDKIKKANPEDCQLANNLIVIYLSLDRSKPSDESLGRFIFRDGKLINDKEEYVIKVITYEKEILSWIKRSKLEVGNITNLSMGLKQYEDVILQLYGKARRNLMSLVDYINDQNDKIKIIHTLKCLNEEYPKLRENMIGDFFDKAATKLASSLNKLDGWGVYVSQDELSRTDIIPIKIKPTESAKIVFGFAFERSKYHDAFYGIARNDEGVDFRICFKSPEIVDMLKENNSKHISKSSDNGWWLTWDWFSRGDIFDYILESGGVDKAVDKFTENIVAKISENKELIIKCNEIIMSCSNGD